LEAALDSVTKPSAKVPHAARGKTMLLNALANEILDDERIFVIEARQKSSSTSHT